MSYLNGLWAYTCMCKKKMQNIYRCTCVVYMYMNYAVTKRELQIGVVLHCKREPPPPLPPSPLEKKKKTKNKYFIT